MDHRHHADYLLERYERTRDAELLIRAAGLYRRSLAAAASTSDSLAVTKRLARLLADHPSQFPDTDETTGLILRILAVVASADPDRFEWSRLLVKVRCTAYLASGDLDDLGRTFNAIYHALATCTASRHGMVVSLLNLIPRPLDALARRQDWNRLINLYEQILALIGPEDPERRIVIGPLVSALRNRYQRDHGLADLERALNLCQGDLASGDPDAGDRDERLAGLANVLIDCFIAFGSRDDIDRAVDLHLQAADAAQPSRRRQHLTDAADAAHRRFEAYHLPEDLDLAIDLLRHRVTDPLDPGPGDLAPIFQATGYLVQECDRTGDIAHLRRAVSMLLKSAAERNLAGYWADYCELLIHAGALLRHRYDHTGEASFMRQAVDLLHDGIAECPTHCVPWPRSRLLEAIAETFSGWPGHSDEASAAMEEATQALLIGAGECEDARDSSALLSRAGELLVQQYGRQADPELMDRAVDCYQQAADAAESSPEWPRHLSRLATTITARYELTGDPADLERARSLRRRAAEAVDMQRPSPLREQTRLATALAALIRARSSKD